MHDIQSLMAGNIIEAKSTKYNGFKIKRVRGHDILSTWDETRTVLQYLLGFT